MPVYLRHNSPAHPIGLGLAQFTYALLFSASIVFVLIRLDVVHPYKYKLFHDVKEYLFIEPVWHVLTFATYHTRMMAGYCDVCGRSYDGERDTFSTHYIPTAKTFCRFVLIFKDSSGYLYERG